MQCFLFTKFVPFVKHNCIVAKAIFVKHLKTMISYLTFMKDNT